jgi:hypothetical protein
LPRVATTIPGLKPRKLARIDAFSTREEAVEAAALSE